MGQGLRSEAELEVDDGVGAVLLVGVELPVDSVELARLEVGEEGLQLAQVV